MRPLIIVMMAAALTACGHRTSQGSGSDSTATDSMTVLESRSFAVDSIGLVREDSMVAIYVSADWPVNSNDSLAASVRRYICEELANRPNQESKPQVVYTDNLKQLLSQYTDEQYNDLQGMWQEANDGGYAFGMTYENRCHIMKLTESDTYVTYLTNMEGFMGGAHGYAISIGQTFRKSDGLRIGYRSEYNPKKEVFEIKDQTLFNSNYPNGLGILIKEGVKSYFKDNNITVPNDSDLMSMLQNVEDVNRIPIPQYPPYFTAEGLQFVYQQYEIGPYAMGMVAFTVPYGKIKALLTTEAQHLIP